MSTSLKFLSRSLEDATKNEEIIWIAYNIATEHWRFEEGLAYSRWKNKMVNVNEKIKKVFEMSGLLKLIPIIEKYDSNDCNNEIAN